MEETRGPEASVGAGAVEGVTFEGDDGGVVFDVRLNNGGADSAAAASDDGDGDGAEGDEERDAS